ncbi:MAG TPA: alpha/beta hydrolase [Aquabacterium sp.]|nr:alpha/beta hydrolase [Aquabacterium sp.]
MNPFTSHRLQSRTPGSPVRVLIVPGLRDSGEAHWQTWLQSQYRGAVRVQQQDWHQPDLQRWAQTITDTLARHDPRTEWVAAAHSFGCLALARHLLQRRARAPQEGGIRAALLVAPADPIKFGVSHLLPTDGLGIPTTLIGSEDDPWMPLSRAQEWARAWGAGFQNLGAVGHINTESGFGPWPLARYKVDHLIRHQQRQHRLERVHPMELSYAI